MLNVENTTGQIMIIKEGINPPYYIKRQHIASQQWSAILTINDVSDLLRVDFTDELTGLYKFSVFYDGNIYDGGIMKVSNITDFTKDYRYNEKETGIKTFE